MDRVRSTSRALDNDIRPLIRSSQLVHRFAVFPVCLVQIDLLEGWAGPVDSHRGVIEVPLERGSLDGCRKGCQPVLFSSIQRQVRDKVGGVFILAIRDLLVPRRAGRVIRAAGIVADDSADVVAVGVVAAGLGDRAHPVVAGGSGCVDDDVVSLACRVLVQ